MEVRLSPGNWGFHDDMSISRGPGGRSIPLLRKLDASAAGTVSRRRPSLPGAGAETRSRHLDNARRVHGLVPISHHPSSERFGRGREQQAADTATARRVCIRFPLGATRAYGHGCGPWTNAPFGRHIGRGRVHHRHHGIRPRVKRGHLRCRRPLGRMRRAQQVTSCPSGCSGNPLRVLRRGWA